MSQEPARAHSNERLAHPDGAATGPSRADGGSAAPSRAAAHRSPEFISITCTLPYHLIVRLDELSRETFRSPSEVIAEALRIYDRIAGPLHYGVRTCGVEPVSWLGSEIARATAPEPRAAELGNGNGYHPPAPPASTEEAGNGHRKAPAIETGEAPVIDEARETEAAPVIEEAQEIEEAPAIEEARETEVTPVIEDGPVRVEAVEADEEPATEEAPALDEAPAIDEAPVLQGAPAAGAEPEGGEEATSEVEPIVAWEPEADEAPPRAGEPAPGEDPDVHDVVDPASPVRQELTELADEGIESPRLRRALERIAARIDVKDHSAADHSAKVAAMACELARMRGLDGRALIEVHLAGLAHDIGKAAIPDHILTKRRPTPEEMAMIRTYPEFGAELLRTVPALEQVAGIVAAHQERWNGNGYPDGLQGTDIPLAAQLVAICDVYLVLTTDRCYRHAYSEERARQIVRQSVGSLWNPEVARAFLKMIDHPQGASERSAAVPVSRQAERPR